MKSLSLVFTIFICCLAAQGEAALYGVARSAAPVLNTPRFSTVFGGKGGHTLKTDSCGQVREMEFVALPGTVFQILGEMQDSGQVIYRVQTGEYPSPAGTSLYVDSRFLEMAEKRPPDRVRKLLEQKTIIAALKGAVGSPYVWGGNVQQGIPKLGELWYRGKFSIEAEKRLSLAGLDCSGLLYQATNGWTPRNTSELVSFGTAVAVEGKTGADIAAVLQPLDLVVWNGHVIIVLDWNTAIESRLECGKPGNGGVVTTPLVQRLQEIMRTRQPVNAWPKKGKQRDIFVVRRWYKALPAGNDR